MLAVATFEVISVNPATCSGPQVTMLDILLRTVPHPPLKSYYQDADNDHHGPVREVTKDTQLVADPHGQAGLLGGL